MKRHQILLLLLVATLYSCGINFNFSSDTNYEYNSTSLGQLKTYTAKPVYKGNKEKALYASASFSNGLQRHEGFNSDSKKAGTISIHRSVTDKHYNLHYGIGATYGQYKFGNDLHNFVTNGEKKDYYALNFKTGINYNKSMKKVDFRIIGLEIAYHYENGSYLRKISEIPTGYFEFDNPYPIGISISNYPEGYSITVKNPKTIFSYNLNTEVVRKLNEKSNLGVSFFFGQTIKSPDMSDFLGFGFFYNYKKITASVVSEVLSRSSNTKLGLTYELFSKQYKKSKK